LAAFSWADEQAGANAVVRDFIRMKLMASLQTQIPDPLRHDLPALLPTAGLTTPTIRVLLDILIGQNGFKSAAMQIQLHDVGSREALLGQAGEKEFIDHAFPRDANPTLLFAHGMGRHHHAAMDAFRPDWHIRTVGEAAHDQTDLGRCSNWSGGRCRRA